MSSLSKSALAGACLLLALSSRAEISDSPASAGPRLKSSNSVLKGVYPTMTRSTEQRFLPVQNGGTTFGGLVNRLLGEAPRRELEGLDVLRHLYHVYAGDQKLGVAHGSTVNVDGANAHVFVFYDPSGKILDVQVEGLTSGDESKVSPHLAHFKGTDATDFEVIRGRRGRITSRGAFVSSVGKLKINDGRARQIFDRVLRAVRFNAAFMDVAYFIKSHPDLADDNRIALSEPVSGPEAFIRSREVASSGAVEKEESAKKDSRSQ